MSVSGVYLTGSWSSRWCTRCSLEQNSQAEIFRLAVTFLSQNNREHSLVALNRVIEGQHALLFPAYRRLASRLVETVLKFYEKFAPLRVDETQSKEVRETAKDSRETQATKQWTLLGNAGGKLARSSVCSANKLFSSTFIKNIPPSFAGTWNKYMVGQNPRFALNSALRVAAAMNLELQWVPSGTEFAVSREIVEQFYAALRVTVQLYTYIEFFRIFPAERDRKTQYSLSPLGVIHMQIL